MAATAEAEATIVVYGVLMLDAAGMPLVGEVGVAYVGNVTAVGGSGSFTYAVSVGALPDGLTLELFQEKPGAIQNVLNIEVK